MPVVLASGVTAINSSLFLWNNLAVGATITATSAIAQHPISNIADPNTWSNWSTVSTSTQHIVFEFSSSQQFNTVGISGHNLFSKVAGFTISRSSNGTSWTNIITHYPNSNEDLIICFANNSYRYVRISVQGASGTIQSGVMISNVFIGQRLLMPSAPLDDYTPLNHAKRYTKLINESLRGHLLGNRVVAAGASTSASWTPLSRTWVDNNIVPFKSHYDQGGTFFYASSPSKYPLDMGYCRANGDDDTVEIQYIEGAKLASVNLSLWSYVNQ